MSATAPLILQRHRLSVADYDRMAQAGILGEDDRCELIEGEIIDMAPIGLEHVSCVNRLNQLFTTHAAGKAIVSVQNPIRLSALSEPQPDIVLLRYQDDFYRRAHPAPADVLLIVEVADASLRYDREVKLPLYARHGIPEVWIVDIQNSRMEIFRGPEGDRYRGAMQPERNATVAPSALPECALQLSALF